jgi:hypothetical protein
MAAPDLINGLGGPAGFGPNILAANDDNSTGAISLSSVLPNGLDFFGTTYTSLFINNNGNITFGSPSSRFTPTQITANTSIPIIAPYFADVDTRGGPGVSTGGNATGSNLLYWNLDTVNHIFTATWDDVGYFNSHTNKLDAFQVQLIDESATGAGNFDIEFRYEAINWTTGDLSNGSNGLGGTVARAGFSAGDGLNFFELPQSGTQSQMLGLPTTAAPAGTLGAQSQTGVYIFHVRNGVVQQSTLFDFVFTYNDGKDYYFGTVADNGTFGYHTGQLLTTASGQYNIYQQDSGTTTAAAGTVSVFYYSHGGPGQASYTPQTSTADGSNGLGSETDSILGTDGLTHPFSASSEAVISTSSLYGFVFNYSDGAADYYGTVADDGTHGYAAIASSTSPYLSVSGGNYYIFSEGTTAEASGTVIVNGYRDGSTATTFPIDHLANGVSEGSAGLGSETGYFLSNGTLFKFTNTEEATDPPLPSGVVAVWAMDGNQLVGGYIAGDTGQSWHLGSSSDANGVFNVVWQNNSGEVATWQANDSALLDNAGFGKAGPSWQAIGTGDYDGSGTLDTLWQSDTGQAIWLMGGSTPTFKAVIDLDPGVSWHLQAS